jgi:hypothetical protein
MPERKESVDSFDEFFGAPKSNEKSPIKSQQNDTSIGAIIKTQPVVKRPQTPLILEERRLSSRMYYDSNFLLFNFLFLISKNQWI